MKPLSDVLHRTPWWALILGGLAALVALAAFVTPYHIIDYRRDRSADAEQRRAIKREVDNAFAESAIDLARNVILGMRRATSDPRRRHELEVALAGLEEARLELREAGGQVLRAKREAAEDATRAIAEAARAIREARRDAARALREAGVPDEQVSRSLQESLEAVRRAEAEARRAARAARKAVPAEPQVPKPAESPGEEAPSEAAPPVAREPDAASADAQSAQAPVNPPRKRRLKIEMPGGGNVIDIELPDKGGVALAGPGALPPELRQRIRTDVTHDLYRIGLGAGLILIFIPLFVLTVIAKLFIDRSRAAQRTAELKRREADYHRMSQQVTEAKLAALQAQVEPHFLYNTLASVQALTEVDPQQAHAMTGHLIQYLRNALPKMRESVSTVGQEVELVRAYLNILQMRMGRRLSFTISVPPELLDAPFPPLMLPSLVENAIKHGLEPQREGGEVRITAEEVAGRLRMIVADTGRGFSETPGAGVGLANVRERLAAMYGGQARLTLEAREPHGVVATIDVPKGAARAGSHGPVPAALSAPADAEDSARSAAPRGAARRTLAAMGTAERWWRKAISVLFVGLVVVAAVMAVLGVVGVASGVVPLQLGAGTPGGPGGAVADSAVILVVFAVVVLVLAVVAAVIYGLGFVLFAVAVFVPLVVILSLSPVLLPVALAGLLVWWLVRRKRRAAPVESPDAQGDHR